MLCEPYSYYSSAFGCPKMVSEVISENLISKNFLGEHAPRPLVLHAYAHMHAHIHVTPFWKSWLQAWLVYQYLTHHSQRLFWCPLPAEFVSYVYWFVCIDACLQVHNCWKSSMHLNISKTQYFSVQPYVYILWTYATCGTFGLGWPKQVIHGMIMMLAQSVGIGNSSLMHLRFPLLNAVYMLYLLAILLQAISWASNWWLQQ